MLRVTLALLLLAACQRPALVGANGVLRVTETRLDFGERWLNSKTTKRLLLANTGRAALDVLLFTTAPFDVAPALTLGGGESVELELHFTPSALGDLEAQLIIEVDTTQHRLTLAGVGIDAPACDSTLCRTATLDEQTARCVLSAVPDGEACNDACLESAHCEAGGCIGQPKSCDDGDRCTVDACDSQSGCAHAPVVCRPSSPCMTGRCDPSLGCVETPAEDGAACGEADCVTAHVCIQGQCVTRTVPEGAACGRETLCQTQGRCTAQVCVQTPATPLLKLWSHELTRAGRVHGLVSDAPGNLFTVECVYAGSFRAQCSMLSLSPAGAVRFRTAFPHVSDTGSGGLWSFVVVAGDLIISGVEQSHLVAFDRMSGQLAWTVDTRTLGLFPPSTTTVRPVAVGFDGAHTVIAALEATSFGSITGSAFIGLELTTGALARAVPLPAQAVSLVLDRSSNLYLGHGSGGMEWADTITSFNAAWSLRWQRIEPVADNRVRFLTAAHQDQLFWSHDTLGELASSTNGATSARPAPQGFTHGAVWSDDALFVLRQFCPVMTTCRGFSDFRLEVQIFPSDRTGPRRAALPALSWFSSPWLTADGDALLSFREATLASTAVLVAFDAQGTTTLQCPLGLENRRSARADPVFSAGRYVLLTAEDSEGRNPRIDVFGLPGLAPANRGWISERGGPGQDLRER